MAITKTSFNSERGRVAGVLGARALIQKYGREHFRQLALKSWRKRRAKRKRK